MLFSAGRTPDWHVPVHCGWNFAVINRQEIPTIGRVHTEDGSQPMAVFLRLRPKGRAGDGDTAPPDYLRRAAQRCTLPATPS
jgi:hypothetical protein